MWPSHLHSLCHSGLDLGSHLWLPPLWLRCLFTHLWSSSWAFWETHAGCLFVLEIQVVSANATSSTDSSKVGNSVIEQFFSKPGKYWRVLLKFRVCDIGCETYFPKGNRNPHKMVKSCNKLGSPSTTLCWEPERKQKVLEPPRGHVPNTMHFIHMVELHSQPAPSSVDGEGELYEKRDVQLWLVIVTIIVMSDCYWVVTAWSFCF